MVGFTKCSHIRIMFRHGYVGGGNRKVAPSCVVWKIRDKCPATDDVYLGC